MVGELNQEELGVLYRRVDCPHCGNEITVNSGKETTKCFWCRRIVEVKFTGNSRKKAKVDVKAIDFPEEQNTKTRSYNSWKDKDVYGYK